MTTTTTTTTTTSTYRHWHVGERGEVLPVSLRHGEVGLVLRLVKVWEGFAGVSRLELGR